MKIFSIIFVSHFQFDVILDLSQVGYDFILFDSDVFLSPSHHPLTSMIDFTDSSWDIQFQLDHSGGRINIGWFWARPSIGTIGYFNQSKRKWESAGGWDQAVMNTVLTRMETVRKTKENFQRLSIRRLDPRKFINFMNTHWYRALSPTLANQTNFYNLNDDARYELIKNASEEAVIWHYTCVEKPLKLFFAKYFGQWTNLDEYYTRERRFLAPINIGHGSGNSTILLIQFLIAVKLALISERALIFPDTVSYHPFIKFPGVRIFSISELHLLGIEYVESTYLYNRKLKHNIDVSTKYIFPFSTTNNETVIHLLKKLTEELGLSLRWKELVVLDFSYFKAFNELMAVQNFDEWWKKHITIKDQRNMNINNIRLCRNRNDKYASCLKICK